MRSVRPVPAQALRRPILFGRLDAARARPATWVEGPPGAGKTTLLASWLQGRRGPSLWLTLDATDAEPATFLEDLAGAVRERAPTAALPRFGPEYAAGLGTLFRRFFVAVAAALPGPLVLVLDDCSEVPDEAPLFALLAAGLAGLRPRGSAFLLGRRPPPPALAGPGPGEPLGRLGPAELRLSPDEVAAVARLHGLTEPRRVAALVEAVDGWAAGVPLQLAAARDWPAAPGALPVSPATFDYLASEVLDRTDPATRRLLLEASVLPWVDAAAAEAALGLDGLGALLARLAGQGYFTTPLEGPGPRYRFHPLFHALLRARAAQELAAPRLEALLLQGAALLEAQGEEAEALALLRDAGAWDSLASLVLRCGPRLVAAGRVGALAGWLAALPAPQLAANPGLRYLRGLATFAGEPGAAQADLVAALDAFEASGDATGAYLAWAAWAEALVYGWTFGPLATCLDRLEGLRARFGMPSSPELVARLLGSALQAYLYGRPQAPAFRDWVAQGDVAARAVEPRTRTLAVIAVVNVEANVTGDLAHARQVLDGAALQPGADAVAEVGRLEGESLYCLFTAQGERGVALTRRALRLAAASGVRVWDELLTAQLAWTAAVGGELRLAEQACSGLALRCDGARPIVRSWLHSARTLLAVARGDRARAREEARAWYAFGEPSGLDAARLPSMAALATRVLLDGVQVAGAPSPEACLEVARRFPSRLLENQALLALAAHAAASGAPDRALRVGAALRQAAETGYRVALSLLPSELAGLCAVALEEGVEAQTAREYVLANRLQPPPGLPDTVAWPRELELQVLGEPALALRGRPLAPGEVGQRGLELLTALAARGAGPVPAAEVAEALWPAAEGDAALHALETAVYRLRRVLGSRDLLQLRGGALRLAEGRCRVDLWELERRLGAVERHGPPASAEGRRAEARALEALHRGPLLPALEVPWVGERRRHLERRVARALEQLRPDWTGPGRGEVGP